MSLFGYVYYFRPVYIPCHITLPQINRLPHPPPSKSCFRIYSFLLANIPDPPPPPLYVRSRSPLPLSSLWIRSVPRFPVTVSDSEPSLPARLWRDPANAWLAAPNSDRPDALAPEELLLWLCLWCNLEVGRGEGGVQVELRAPPMILDPKIIDVYVHHSSTV